jgi:hypothetical protein
MIPRRQSMRTAACRAACRPPGERRGSPREGDRAQPDGFKSWRDSDRRNLSWFAPRGAHSTFAPFRGLRSSSRRNECPVRGLGKGRVFGDPQGARCAREILPLCARRSFPGREVGGALLPRPSWTNPKAHAPLDRSPQAAPFPFVFKSQEHSEAVRACPYVTPPCPVISRRHERGGALHGTLEQQCLRCTRMSPITLARRLWRTPLQAAAKSTGSAVSSRWAPARS